MKKTFLLSLLILSCAIVFAQKTTVVDSYYPLLRNLYNGNNAYNTVAFVEKYWRIAGNTGFNESIYRVEKILQEAGFKKEVKGEADGPLTYRIETRKMRRPTWEPVSSSLTIVGESAPLLESVSNRNMIAINSASTPVEGETAELIYVGKGTPADFQDKDVKGKIVFGETSTGGLFRNAISKGAIGVMGYSMPKYTQPEKNIHSIQFTSIAYDSAKPRWGIVLSFNAKEKLKAALAKGPVRVNVKVVSKIYPSEELTIVANARGTEKPDERFVYSAHVQEPGANDNATGVGTLAEMARVTAALIKQKKFLPKRTITFLWGDEIVSTRRYIQDDSVRAKGIKWGLSLDMVGEDVSKTGGTFLIEKMPDPSAIWTRGNDKHTEWGGGVLKESDMFPHYFNDFLLNRCRQQAKGNDWIVNSNPYEGGSDHQPFLNAKIPGVLMWHFTDVFYHTDGDRLNMVSAKEMKNVGVSALAAAFTLCSANEATALSLIDEISKNALDRLQAEYTLSKEALQNGSTAEKEQHILKVWSDWYKTALGRMSDINVGGVTIKIQKKIEEAQSNIGAKTDSFVGLLGAK
ncbi:MAG: peptidase [Sediminibacterium sp.]|nr:peptidase [Sediminibacterium sp.]